MKIEYTPTHHRREYNASEATQASFLATFKAIRNKLCQKRHRYCVPAKKRVFIMSRGKRE